MFSYIHTDKIFENTSSTGGNQMKEYDDQEARDDKYKGVMGCLKTRAQLSLWSL